MRKTAFVFMMSVIFSGLCVFIGAQIAALTGDVNNDGQITIVDALMVAQYSVGLQPAVFNAGAADVNGTGTINIVDALLIAQYYVGIIGEFPVAGSIEVARSDIQRNPSPQPAGGELETVATGINSFAFDCYSQLKGGDENIFFSPVSISFALAMCYAGANGSTETEIGNTMHFILPEDKLHNAFNALDLALTAPLANPNPAYGDEVQLNLANSSWGQKGYPFLASYLDTLAYNYGAGMYLLDFFRDPENCRGIINNWVSEKTQNRINDLLPLGSISVDTRMVLTNAVYFKANWFYPFSVSSTINSNFYLLDGSTVNVSLMRRSPSLAYKEVAGEYQAVRLPYQGTKGFCMLIVLPAEGKFRSFENSLNLAAYTTILQGMSSRPVNLSMPKFTFEWAASLKPALQSLGMTDSFDSVRANFSGIVNPADGAVYIFDVIHKAFVAVDEKGTEASAATAVIATAVPSMTPQPVTMSINRPFLFFIYGPTGSILFMGSVLNPGSNA